MTTKHNTLDKIVWPVILGFIFIRPFVCESAFVNLNLIVVNIFIIASSLYLYSKDKDIKATVIDTAVIVFLTAIIISAIIATGRANNINELYNYISLVTLFYVVRAVTEENKKKVIFTIIISAVFVSLYSLRALFIVSGFTLKYLSNHNISYPFAEEFIKRGRAFSPFISPNILAGYLVMIIILCCGIITQRIKDKKNDYMLIVSGLCAALSFAVLFFTKSIGGWLVLTACVLIFLTSVKRLNRKYIAVLFSVIMISSAVFIIRNRGQEYFTKPAFSAHKRINYWKQTAHIIALHPLGGTGLGNFSLKESRTSHNSYLQIWAEMGISAIVVWLIIVFLFIRTGINNIYYNKRIYYNAGILTAGSAFILHNIIDFSFFTAQSPFLWWIVLALNASITQINTEEYTDKRQSVINQRPSV